MQPKVLTTFATESLFSAQENASATFVGCVNNQTETHRAVVGYFILKKWKLPLSGLAVVRYSDKCGRAKGDPDLRAEFATKMIS